MKPPIILLFSLFTSLTFAQSNAFFKTDTTTKATPLFKLNSSQPLRQTQKLPGLNFEYNKLVKPKVIYTMPIEKPKVTYKMPNYFTESKVKRSLVVIETE